MANRRGRRPKSTLIPIPVGPSDRAIEDLLSPAERRKTVTCPLCSQPVPEIPGHLAAEHQTVTLEEFQQSYPDAPLEPVEVKKARERASKQRLEVSDEEGEAHPCGFDGALLEKSLKGEERTYYRRDIQNLLRRGYEPGYEVAAVAHSMTLARRVRLDVEEARVKSGGAVYQSEMLSLATDLEAKIEKGIAALERARRARIMEEGEDPVAALDREQRTAEEWIMSRIGELAERCPGCGLILTPPALPHWAFEPTRNAQGVTYYPVWSAELWKLVIDRTIPLWVMAYTLRTAPEGLLFTARRKHIDWPTWIEIEWEEQQLRTRLVADDRATPVSVELARMGGTHGSG
jgi:hypothetical protein